MRKRPGAEKIDTTVIAGVDEAGRGPLAGPVFAAAVVLDGRCQIEGLADSKTLTPRIREQLAKEIKERAIGWALGRAGVADIDRLNILQATLLAMSRAVVGLPVSARLALVDGNCAPRLACPVQTIIGGDVRVPEIAAASILAKVARDAEMCALDPYFPVYGFAQHKGYATPAHLQALQRHGVTPIHRRSFAPVRRRLMEHGY
jgi:ribonuclease HII